MLPKLVVFLNIIGGQSAYQWIAVARKQAEFMYRNFVNPSKRVTKMGDAIIDVTVNKNIANIYITAGDSITHRFLFYEKTFNGGAYPYGYWFENTTDAQRTMYVREHSYLIDEPQTTPMDWQVQINSITRQEFKYKKSGLSGYPKEKKVIIGRNDRYGNQYRVVNNDVYSWWHSGFGDLPIIEYDTYAEFLAAESKFLPAYVIEVAIGYVYLTEETGYARKVPVSLYKNGELFLECGQEGGSLICDVIERDGDLLILLNSYNSIGLIRYRETDVVQQVTLGSVISGTILAGWPWRFSDSGLAFGGLMYYLTDPPDSVSTIHLFEYSLSRDSEGNYSWSQTTKTSYIQTYHDVKTTTTISEYVRVNNPGGYLYWDNVHVRNGSLVSQTTDITADYPIAANYIGESLSVARLSIEKEYTYNYSVTSGNDNDEWSKYYNPDTPVIGYWVISGKNDTQYTSNSDKSTTRQYLYSLSLPRSKIKLGELSCAQTEAQHLDNFFTEDVSLHDIAFAGDPEYLAYCRKFTNYDYGTTYSKTVSETVTGYLFQLRHIDVKRSTVAWIKINYDISRTGSGYQETGTTDHSTTIYVNYLQPDQSVTTTRELTSYRESVHPDPSVTFNNRRELDTGTHLITPFSAMPVIEVDDTELLNINELYSNSTYTWTQYKDEHGNVLSESGNYTDASQYPNIGPQSEIGSYGYSHAGSSGTVTIVQSATSPFDFEAPLFVATPSMVIEPGLEIAGERFYSSLFHCNTAAFNVAFNDAGKFSYLAFTYYPGVLESSPIYKSVIHTYLPEVNTLDADEPSIYPIGFF